VPFYAERARERMAELERRVEGVASAALLGGLFISFGVAASWTRPIGRLAEAAQRLGEGRYDLALRGEERRADEVGALAKAFAQTAQQLQQLDAVKEDFVSSVTHELRSPLSAIESYLN